jgi:hypothetical protein
VNNASVQSRDPIDLSLRTRILRGALISNRSGTYTVTITTPEGCSGSAAVKVTVNTAAVPVISASNGTTTGTIDITAGDRLVLTASAGSKTYLWSTGETTPSITPTTTRDYTVTVTDTNGCVATSAARHVNVHPLPPSSVTATAAWVNGSFQVSLTCPTLTGMTYKFQRSTNLGTTWTDVSNPDTGVSQSQSTATTYLYRALSNDGAQWSLRGPIDLATTITFADDPIVRGTTTPKLSHLTQLRTAIDAVRVAAGLSAATWSAPPAAQSSPISVAQLSELRARLGEALAVLVTLDPSLGVPQYTDPSLASGLTIKADYIQQLRDRVK